MKDFIDMEKAEFEAAINAYTDKIIDEDNNLVKYVMRKSIRTDILNRSGDVIAHEIYRVPKQKQPVKTPIMGRPSQAVTTPQGTYLNIHHAAEAHQITMQAMRARIGYARKQGKETYYYVEEK